MTTYSTGLVEAISSGGGGTTHTVAIRRVLLRAGSYAIKISSITLGAQQWSSSPGQYSSGGSFYINHYIGSTISGGSAYTPVPMREGANPASATLVYQTVTTNTGTGTPTFGTAVSVTGTAQNVDFNTDTPWTPPSDFLIAPGSVLEIVPIDITTSLTFYTTFASVKIYFNEYHLGRSV